MGKIIRNGVEYSGATEDATAVNYDNSLSGLNAQTVQEAVDELTDSLGEKYSTTEEVKIGTWIDGKPLYRKVLVFDTLASQSATKHNIPNIDHIHLGSGSCAHRSDGWVMQTFYNGNTDYFSMIADKTRVYCSYGAGSTTITNFVYVLEYTKTTD